MYLSSIRNKKRKIDFTESVHSVVHDKRMHNVEKGVVEEQWIRAKDAMKETGAATLRPT